MGQALVLKTEGGGPTEGDPLPFPWPGCSSSCLLISLLLSARAQPALLSFFTASLGQLFATRFTFLLIFFLPSRAVPSASPFAIKWVYAGQQQFWGWPRGDDGSRIDSLTTHSFLHSTTSQPTNLTWLLCAPVLALLGTQPRIRGNSQRKQTS